MEWVFAVWGSPIGVLCVSQNDHGVVAVREVFGYYMRMFEGSQECAFDENSPYVELAAEVFSLLSDPTRIRIVLALRAGELAVGELAERVGKSPTVVSQHLARLRWARTVAARQEGTRAYYHSPMVTHGNWCSRRCSRPNTPSTNIPATMAAITRPRRPYTTRRRRREPDDLA